MERQRKTIRDVARRAGVSVATVSRVLNSPAVVKQKTRARVLRSMEDCQYVYNAVAGGLSARRTTTIGVIVPTITNPVFATVTKGIQDFARESGYSILLGNSDYDEANELRLIHLFQQKRADGVILNGPWRDAAIVPLMKRTRLPFVITWQTLRDRDVNFVAFDNAGGAYRVVEHLLELGHRRIGMIAGKFSVSERAFIRWEGYRKCLLDHGIRPDPALVVEKGYTFTEGKEGMAQLLGAAGPPTAVFCGNDILAIGAIACAKERGLTVPGDVSVAGFDDMEISAYYDPPLTTVAVPAYEMGRLAAQVLLENIRGEEKRPRQVLLETQLMVRGSVEPLRRARKEKGGIG
ncbi:MAG TPA: LacI family DNA-binding transcriptional regulator [Thermodesulfobacteriota bacterium]|nr:LacI family DNA-binding transcriptional regulator [Thermodesulfobacteriota bacterium]